MGLGLVDVILPLDREDGELGVDLEVLLVVVPSEVVLGQLETTLPFDREDGKLDLNLVVLLVVVPSVVGLGLARDRRDAPLHLGQEDSLVSVHYEGSLWLDGSSVVASREVGLGQVQEILALERGDSSQRLG